MWPLQKRTAGHASAQSVSLLFKSLRALRPALEQLVCSRVMNILPAWQDHPGVC